MKAVLMKEVNHLEFVDVENPQPKDDEVLLKRCFRYTYQVFYGLLPVPQESVFDPHRILYSYTPPVSINSHSAQIPQTPERSY